MIEVFKNFDVTEWLLTGGLGLLLTSVVTIIVMLIKQRINAKSDIMQRQVLNESTMSTLIAIGADIKQVLESIKILSNDLPAISEQLQKVVTTAATNNTNLANFVLECFSESNLSDEKKAKLKSLFEKTFFSDNEQLIDALKTAKANSDLALTAANQMIEHLTAAAAQKDAEILSLQTTRKSRRA